MGVAKIPLEATSFFWIYPLIEHRVSTRELTLRKCSKEELDDPLVHLFQRGAFCYVNKAGQPILVSAVSNKDSQGFLQFGKRIELPANLANEMSTDRFRPVPRRYREA